MAGFDPLGFRATNWRAVFSSLLFTMIIVIPILCGVMFSGMIQSNPTAYPPLLRKTAFVFPILLVIAVVALKIRHLFNAPREAQELASELRRVQGEFKKLQPAQRQSEVQEEAKR